MSGGTFTAREEKPSSPPPPPPKRQGGQVALQGAFSAAADAMREFGKELSKVDQKQLADEDQK